MHVYLFTLHRGQRMSRHSKVLCTTAILSEIRSFDPPTEISKKEEQSYQSCDHFVVIHPQLCLQGANCGGFALGKNAEE